MKLRHVQWLRQAAGWEDPLQLHHHPTSDREGNPSSSPEGTEVVEGGGRMVPMVIDDAGSVRHLSSEEGKQLRRRVINRQSARRMRAKRQEELFAAHSKVWGRASPCRSCSE